MRFLRNRSVAVKLAMSAACAIVLLVVLAMSARHAMSVLAAVQDRVSDAVSAERRIKDVQLRAEQMATLGRELQSRQTVADVTRLAAKVDQVGGEAHEVIAALRAKEGDGVERHELTAALDALSAFAGALHQEAEQRKALIITRQKQLIELRPTFEASLNSFLDELAKGGVVAGGVDAVTGETKSIATPEALTAARDAFARYQFAMARMQNAALLFLATGNRGVASEVQDAANDAETRLKSALAVGLPQSTLDDMKVVGTLGDAIKRAAQGVVRQSTQLDDFADHTVSLAAQAMSTRLTAAAAAVSAGVEVAHADAEQAQIAARRQMLCISVGIVLVLLISGWLTSRAISRPIRSMTRAVQAIAAGDTDVSIGFADRHDEVGVMAAALEMLRGVAQDAFVKREMIRQFPLGMMMAGADEELRISFINPEAERLLEHVHDHLPAAPNRLFGESLLAFYPDRELQRTVLTDPARLPDRTRVRIGDETFELLASAIIDRSGDYVGPMVTWHRITAQMRLVEQFEQTVGQIAQIVGSGAETMQATARAMTETANDAGVRSVAVAAASDQAATNVSAVAASAEELASSVSEIARQVMESARIAGQAVSEAEAADRSMTGLSDAATRIGNIVKLIGDIAGRTNLLALNATIEAARAGEAGKGFAVVASEVKTLATQTARATEDIGAQIAAMQSATGQAVETLRSIGATIERMNEIATAIAGATEQQGAATREIARAVQQAAAGTAEVTSNIAGVARAVDGTSGQAGETLAAATELATQSERLRVEAERFLTAVQEAA